LPRFPLLFKEGLGEILFPLLFKEGIGEILFPYLRKGKKAERKK